MWGFFCAYLSGLIWDNDDRLKLEDDEEAELLDMVADSAEERGHSAEAEALGFNATRIHPDIHMNELLVGMRAIHQVLPAIMGKLGMDDFRLDRSELHIDVPPSGLAGRVNASSDDE